MQKIKARGKEWLDIIKETFKEFSEDNVMHFGASLSYYTIFALPPIITVIITLAGTLFGQEAVSGHLYYQLSGMLGEKGALEVQNIVELASKLKPNLIAKIVGVAAIIISSTGVFLAIQDALNAIWSVKAKPKSGIVRLVVNRALSFAMVMSIGFLLMVSLVIHAAVQAISVLMEAYFKSVTLIFMQVFNLVLPIAIITVLFALIFKFLPDAKIRWKDVWVGAFVTSLLFSLGKFLIGFYLGNTDVGSAYGAAGIIIILLTWIFYSSILLFLGAEFTKVYSSRYGKGIQPSEFAVRIVKTVVEKGKMAE